MKTAHVQNPVNYNSTTEGLKRNIITKHTISTRCLAAKININRQFVTNNAMFLKKKKPVSVKSGDPFARRLWAAGTLVETSEFGADFIFHPAFRSRKEKSTSPSRKSND